MTSIINKLDDTWGRINTALINTYPEYAGRQFLLPPITEEKIREIENHFSVTFPGEYRESLKIHEGTGPAVWLWDAIAISDLDLILEDHAVHMRGASHPSMKGMTLRPSGPVSDKLFEPLWIPVASDNGIPICLDFAPAPGGQVGQIIYVDWEDDTVKVIAKNFIEFLEAGLSKMELKI